MAGRILMTPSPPLSCLIVCGWWPRTRNLRLVSKNFLFDSVLSVYAYIRCLISQCRIRPNPTFSWLFVINSLSFLSQLFLWACCRTRVKFRCDNLKKIGNFVKIQARDLRMKLKWFLMMVLSNGISGFKSPVFFHINPMKYSSDGLFYKNYVRHRCISLKRW